ncbi:dihydroorotate dehydrogenase electron transfer subunit [Pseudovibrio exalbescens]|uniref:dihydroorotate dehydrogenase electron transfer subunit n=1 Tax=Pseudovibrio exalbescens TaxID=197461 RepID=UPI002365A7E1|nr:dihydroorotate dehydrogenase electron transfer subunit [Pseudovibrio exalbescens]MDD7909929.1 dihydroorotate dehydrogenase electron transfer subunit [Pseudovibrio exalbescens]
MIHQDMDPASARPEAGLKAFEALCTVKSNTSANDDYRLLVLEAPKHILNCQPGQFFHLLCPVTDQQQPYLRRPMSIYRFDADKGELAFLYKVAGEGTAAMATLKPGELFNVLGPLGVGYTIKPEWQNLLLVARGVGLATLAPLAQEAARLGRKLTAICSARSEAALLSTEHFRSLGAQVISVTDEDGSSSVENLQTLIEGLIGSQGVDAFYTCGSNRLLKLLQELGAKHNIPGEIALEQQMACGLGMCQCCVRPFSQNGEVVHLRVCKEGPVFDLQEAMGW